MEDLDENMYFETFLQKIDKNLPEKEYLDYIKYTGQGTNYF